MKLSPLLFLSLLLLGLSHWGAPPHDPDLGWHLLGGTITLRDKIPPISDPINTFSTIWVDYHWLVQILFAFINDNFGLTGLKIMLALIMAATVSILFCNAKQILSNSTISAALVSALMLCILSEVTSIRPQAFSVLLLATAQLLLLNKKPTRLELPALFAISVLMTNMHVYWVFVPFLFFIYRGIPYIQKRSFAVTPNYFWSGVMLLGLSGLISPYAIFGPWDALPYGALTTYGLIYDYALQAPELKNYIIEFHSAFKIDSHLRWGLLLFPALVMPILLKPKILAAKLPFILTGLFAFIMSVKTLKFLALFGIMGLPLVCLSVSRLKRNQAARIVINKMLPMKNAFCVAFFVICLTQAIRLSPWVYDSSHFMENLPKNACEHIAKLSLKNSSGREHIRLATSFDAGGWCRYFIYITDANADIRVTTDGRTQFIDPKEYIKAFDVYRVNYQWIKTLREWNPDVVLAERGRALSEVLSLASTDWKLSYHDEKFTVFVARKNQPSIN